ncbi:uncharacterized protein LOC115569568 [Sparus aurata]|uniref:uncharacterized protein LOC115569568 n=1 Tax=Sparus aurata TaxID=8175 RepID=UPI0011C11D18|nr:uncharacterized protein LOC115569568 [Sparus aurata]
MSATQTSSASRPQISPPLSPLDTTDLGTQKRRPEPASHNNTEIIFLCDSNGKYINMKRLFPGRRSKMIWSPTISEAIKKLATTDLQGVKHILIHTGTNDLTHNKNIPQSLRQVAERATSVAPTARVTISTLLPRRDVPQHEINKINAEISKACTGIPNVHMAHHAEILCQHLYDSLHLNQSGVRLFIKDIKDTALDRNRSAPHITNKSTSNHRNLHRRLQHTRGTTNNGRSFSQRLGPASRYYAPAAPLQGPSPNTPLYTSAPPPQDYNPTAPHYILPPLPPLQGPSPITPL